MTNRLTGILLATLLAPLSVTSAQAEQAVQSYQSMYEDFVEKQASKSSNFTAEDRAIMQKASQQLQQQLTNPGIAVGKPAPAFSLPNAFGDTIRLTEQLEQGPVILVFYRGAWCPYCNLYLHALQKNLSIFKQYNASLITITPQQPDKSAEQIKKDKYPFEVLSDLDSRVMQAYNLYFRIPDELVAVYKKAGLDIEDYNGKNRNVLPVPGTFIIDQQGIVRAMHAETDYKKRMEPADIIQTLKTL